MQRFSTRTVIGLVTVLIPALTLVSLVGCGPTDPMEQVAEQRSQYRASLNSMTIREEPIEMEEPEATADEEEGAAGDAAAPAAGGDGEIEVAELEPVPVTQIALLDILVQNDSYERLPGVTLDVSMVDGAQVEKGHWKVWIDTTTLGKGGTMSVTHEIEDVDYVEGDGFFVEVRHPIPPAERGDYREFNVGEPSGG